MPYYRHNLPRIATLVVAPNLSVLPSILDPRSWANSERAWIQTCKTSALILDSITEIPQIAKAKGRIVLQIRCLPKHKKVTRRLPIQLFWNIYDVMYLVQEAYLR